MLSSIAAARFRAAAGALLLDGYGSPGWELRLRAGDLNISCIYSCVLGQLYGTFGDGVMALGERFDRAFTYTELLGYGFIGGHLAKELDATPATVPYVSDAELTWAWRAEIGERLNRPVEPFLERIGVVA